MKETAILPTALPKARKNYTLLITGGCGYIGSHAVLSAIAVGWDVVVLDNLSTGFRFAIPAHIPFYKADIADQVQLETIFAVHNIGAILHFAGSVIVPESVNDPLKYYANNSAKTRDLIAAAVKANIAHFIFSSTAATYGIPDNHFVTEDTPQVPINPYGTSKLMTEMMLRDVARAYPMNFCALRYFNVAGADPNGRAGQSTKGATHLIKVAVEAALGKRGHVNIFGSDFTTADGTGIRDYIHVTDLANAHIFALDKLIRSPEKSHFFNCGYGRGYSVIEVLDAVEQVANVRLTRILQERRPGDASALVANNKKILEHLKWRPQYDKLELIIEHALNWERSLDNPMAMGSKP